MDTITAYAIGRAAKERGEAVNVFDWDKAAALIKERKPQEAEAGLASDYKWTRGTIYRDGKIVTDEYTYLASNWATPMLILDGEEIPCHRDREGSGWDAKTKWPDSARALLANSLAKS